MSCDTHLVEWCPWPQVQSLGACRHCALFYQLRDDMLILLGHQRNNDHGLGTWYMSEECECLQRGNINVSRGGGHEGDCKQAAASKRRYNVAEILCCCCCHQRR